MFEPRYVITDAIANDLVQIGVIKSQIDGTHIRPEREAELHYRATVEATHSSTSIEGNPLTDKQIDGILSNKNAIHLTRHQYAEIEVRNYQRALQWIETRKRGDHKLSLTDILMCHSLVTANLLPEQKSGYLRTNPVYIQNEHDEVLYTAPASANVKSELQKLLEWINDKSNELSPVIAAAILHFQLVSIHPFADGNGRTTRIMTMLYLGLRKYDLDGSLVLDTYYASDRRGYYNALHSAQGTDYNSALANDMTPWLGYFTQGFLSSIKVLLATITILANTTNRLSIANEQIDRDSVDILSYVHQFGSITVADAIDILGGVTVRTAQRKLKKLVDDGYLTMVGEARNTKYVQANAALSSR